VLDEWRMDAQRAMEIARKHGVLTLARRTIVGDTFQWFCDIPDFVIWMIEKPELVREFLGIFQQWSLELTRLALDVGVDVVMRRGWYEIPAFWGPRFFQEYLAPLIETETRLVHEAGKFHCYLLPEGQGAYALILKDMGVDVLMGVDPRMLHGGDLKSLFAQVGDRKAFWGGVNAEVTLESEDPATIEKEVADAIEALGGKDGFILGAFIFQQITPKSIQLLIDAYKKHR
jgi:uroporphyrinogen-III decarboxylase